MPLMCQTGNVKSNPSLEYYPTGIKSPAIPNVIIPAISDLFRLSVKSHTNLEAAIGMKK